jgi:hypothetical protein
MKYRVNLERGDEFEERLNLYIYLLDLCNNITHAQRVYDSWLEWYEKKKTQ